MTAQPNQSLIDGITCLQELSSSSRPLGNKELAERLGINVVKVNRLLKSLKSIGMVEQNKQRKYVCGSGIHLLAAQSLHNSTILRASLRVALGQDYNDRTLAIGTLWRTSVIYTYYALDTHSPLEGLSGYRTTDVNVSTIGQALLAEKVATNDLDNVNSDQISEELLCRLPSISRQLEDVGYFANFVDEQFIDNICILLRFEGMSIGLAFANINIHSDDLQNYVQELRAIASAIKDECLTLANPH